MPDLNGHLDNITMQLKRIADSLDPKREKPSGITPEVFARRMKEISDSPYIEDRHILADDLMVSVLIQLGYEEGTNIFKLMEKWYS